MHPAPDTLDHLAAALKEQWKRYRKELRACQRNSSAQAVHETRVASRRLLALVELIDPLLSGNNAEAARGLLKRHLDAFDDLRDTHVQLVAATSLRRTFPAARAFHAYLRRREERLIRRAHKDIQHIKLRRLRQRMAACRTEFEEQRRCRDSAAARARLLRSVDRAFARAQALRARIHPDDTLTIHRTRIAFKKFRYMVEALAGCLPDLGKNLPAAMRRYQVLMGNIQDAEVLLTGLDKFVRKMKPDPNPVKPLRSALLRRQQRLIRIYLKSSGKLDQFWTIV